MNRESRLVVRGLQTPRAAAIAGIVFSVLSIASELMLRSSISADPLGAAREVLHHSRTISIALNLVPYAGIAFLWFIAVVRDRLGKLEDRFFATVLLASGLLYVAMYFVAAGISAGILLVLGNGNQSVIQFGAYAVGRAEVHQILNVYAIRMAGVFMISVSTISLATRIFPRWMAFLGYALALFLLLTVGTIELTPLVFPLWVLSISLFILIEKVQGRFDADS